MPVGWATDLAILELTGSTIEDHGDHLVVRTRENPDYHWGNCLLVTDPAARNDAARWTSEFAGQFPGADWFAVGLPVMPDEPGNWTALGIELEQLDVLSTTTAPSAAPLADGYAVRRLSDGDWDQVIHRDLADNLASGDYDPSVHERFVRETVESRRLLCENDLAAWFGAFADDVLVADLGIVRCGSVGRYQAVGTDARHRRRGLASHLLGVAAGWSAEHGCDAWVIVTESTNDAGRVYRRAGFSLDDAEVNAYRRPPHPAP